MPLKHVFRVTQSRSKASKSYMKNPFHRPTALLPLSLNPDSCSYTNTLENTRYLGIFTLIYGLVSWTTKKPVHRIFAKRLGYFEGDLERFFWTNYFQRDQMMLACMTERSYINLPCFRAGFQARLESEE